MKTHVYLLYLAIALPAVVSCKSKQKSAEPDTNLIEITHEQFTAERMELGESETRVFEDLVTCNGTIVRLPDGLVKVNVPIQGMIKTIFCNPGQFVTKNRPLLEISGNELIDIQKDYAEASANFKRSKNEYERIKSLYEEQVTSEKEFVAAEGTFNIARANYVGLRLKLEVIGLSVDQIEKGEFYASYKIRSSIPGYVSSLQATVGSYVETQSTLMEIINPDRFQVQLSLFTSDIAKVATGQTVRFKPVDSEMVHLANITSIGTSIDNESRSIDCYASFANKSYSHPIARAFVESEIIIRTDTVNALPREAVIESESGPVVLVLQKQENNRYYFKKVDITIGRKSDGYIEILGNKLEGQILVKGTYNISV